MAMMRGWTSAFLLLPALLLADSAASAANRAQPATVGLSSLPHGVHLTRTGRYVRDMCDHAKKRHCLAGELMPVGWTPDKPFPPHVRDGHVREGSSSDNSNGMAPADIINAYNIPSDAAANGKIVAILDSPDSNALSDLQAYRQAFGLPDMGRCSGTAPVPGSTPCFAQVDENGNASTLSADSGEADGETSLDMDMISAACPDCSILLVEIGDAQGNFGDQDFVQGAQTAAMLGASATSISIGGPEQGNDPTGYTTPGHLVLAASGDFGYNLVDQGGQGPDYPASAPDILAIGGTTLFNTGSGYDEGVWNDGVFQQSQNGQDVTSSGCSGEFSALSWQVSALSGSGCSARANADISAAASFAMNTSQGLQEIAIAAYQGGWEPVEGTSASSPMVAGLLVRLGLSDAISNNIGWVYQNASAFNDLGSPSYPVDSSGSTTDAQDPSSCGIMCSVGEGWDGPSGVGTPNGVKLAALAGLMPSVDAGAPPGDSGTVGASPDSGSQPPPADGGGLPTVDGGTNPASTSTAIALGMTCTSGPSCISGICAGASKGAPFVCSETCGAATSAVMTCPSGFDCTSGYCFATASGVDITSDGGGSSGGCAVSGRASSGAGLAWISVGLVYVFAHRSRKRSKRGS